MNSKAIECPSSLLHAACSGTQAPAGAPPGWLGATRPPLVAVDTHAHVFVRGLPLAAQRRHAPEYDATIETYASYLAPNGLSHAVLVQPSFLGTDNRFFVDVMRRYPYRLRGVAVVAPSAGDAELDALAQAGVAGIRLNLIGLPVPDLSQPAWRNLLAHVNALGWHVEVHREAADLPALVGALLAQRCTVVVDHFGRPSPDLGVDDPGFRYLLSVASTGRVWVKLSGAYRSMRSGSVEVAGASAGDMRDADGTGLGARLAAPLLEAFTPERLVWGSDWPHTEHRQHVDYDTTRMALDVWVPDAAQRETILTRSPQTLYRFDAYAG
ncbi:amidohydrolase family protein [Paraburkholderia sp. SARCC-3016]|uniref:amidohydrolase family protein n=1 Tax=Paraburkholderia sp. SARCC-3016 TaxID=3058611 RepID=UPI0028085FC5|nr:amidohydrolase family protein [Paraburkholderia sp. SARCC-3016]MDQ7976976.1 amidohydrolase family protein [Paraburkholderia sp. SARCC-3016]